MLVDYARKNAAKREPRIKLELQPDMVLVSVRNVDFLAVHGEFLLTPPSVFDRAHDNVAANGTIEDSRPSIQMFRSAFSPSAPNDCDARCSSL